MDANNLPFIILGITTLLGLVGWAIQRVLNKAASVDTLHNNVEKLKDDVSVIKVDIGSIKTTLTNHILDETHDVAVVSTKLEQIMKHIDKADK